MSEGQVSIFGEEWKPSPGRPEQTSLITSLGLIEGEALTYVEEHGATTLRRLIQALEWPARLVMMAVGALIRNGLVRAIPHELEVIIEPVLRPTTDLRGGNERVPEAWRG